MNVLFTNYGQADNNSAQHIFGFASGLAARGHDVLVAVAKSVPGGEFGIRDGFRVASHRALLKEGPQFRDRKRADVFHAWTPRENVRLFAENFSKAWGARSLVIHLEDNEEAIFECFTGTNIEDAQDLEREWSKGLIHPRLHRHFMKEAVGVTVVHRCLEPLAFNARILQEIVPVIDFDFFSPAPRDESLRTKLGIGRATGVIVYNGNDHAAAIADIRLLYEAVDLLVDRGRDVALVRTGYMLPTHYEGVGFRPGPQSIELGFIARDQVPAVMGLADVVIQPGNADAFNSFRLPAKIPEYLSMGKPLIMGSTNIGAELAAQNCALVLEEMTARSVADRVEWLLDHPDERTALGKRARAFALERFNGETVIPLLESFYERCLDGAQVPAGGAVVRSRDSGDR